MIAETEISHANKRYRCNKMGTNFTYQTEICISILSIISIRTALNLSIKNLKQSRLKTEHVVTEILKSFNIASLLIPRIIILWTVRILLTFSVHFQEYDII